MRDKLLLTGMLILIAIGVFIFLHFYESYETKTTAGYSIKAQRNYLLAAEQFLEELGTDVDSSIDYLYIDQVPVDTTILLTKVDSMLLTPKQIDAAVEWLQQGGNMIVGAGQETNSVDSLLNRFDVSAEQSYDDIDFDSSTGKLSDQFKRQNQLFEEAQQEVNEDVVSDKSDSETSEPDLAVQVKFSGIDQPLRVEFENEIELYHPFLYEEEYTQQSDIDYSVLYWAENDFAVKLIQIEVGEGLLTILSGTQLWNNHFIDEADNAYLLSELTGERGRVNFYVNINATPLSALLMTHFPWMIFFLLIALLLWLWQQFVRTTSMQEHIIGDRRALSEHLMASSELLSKNNRYDLLMQSLVNDIEQRMLTHKSQFNSLELNEKVELIAYHSNIEQSIIEEWFQQLKNVNDSATFLHAVKTSKLIRNRI